MKYTCKTLFDITATGVTGHFKPARYSTDNEQEWNYARNQQRNWETITQLIGMRTQVFNLKNPVKTNEYWNFTFDVETPDVFGTEDNPVAMLLSDANGIPMLTGLNERENLHGLMMTNGPSQNIWFSVAP
jgi:hypothetical protein